MRTEHVVTAAPPYRPGTLPIASTRRYLTQRARLLYWREAILRYNSLFGNTMEQYIEKVMVPELISKGFLVHPVGPGTPGVI